jgi:hypothetical protein
MRIPTGHKYPKGINKFAPARAFTVAWRLNPAPAQQTGLKKARAQHRVSKPGLLIINIERYKNNDFDEVSQDDRIPQIPLHGM